MDMLDVILPIMTFIAFSLLTIPVMKLTKKSTRKVIFTLIWFSFIFAFSSLSIARLAMKYYAQMGDHPIINVTLSNGLNAIFSSAFTVDAISVYMAIVFTVSSAIAIFYGALFYVDRQVNLSERYYALMLLVTACVLGASLSGDFLTLFIFWEASAVGSAFLMIYERTPRAIHATLKYLIMIVIASAFIIYGLSIIYGLTGTLNFWAVKQALTSLSDKHLLFLAFIFMSTGYAIESAIVPFHMWLPDAYTTAPAPSSAFLSAIVDQGSYYILLRILIYVLTPQKVLDWRPILAVLSALTMIVGNLFALIENNVKRLISYVCIADVGYNLVAITSVTSLGVIGNLYFFFVGGLTTALAFIVVGILNSAGFKTIDDMSGIGRRMPFTSLTFLVGALSFSGSPPFAGFFAKYMVFTAVIEAGLSWLAIIGVVTSVLQAAYFLRIINYMFAKRTDAGRVSEPKQLLILAFILVSAIIILGIYPEIIMALIEPVVWQIQAL